MPKGHGIRNFTDAFKQKVAWATVGRMISEVAAEYNVSKAAVANWRIKYGVPIKPRKTPNRMKPIEGGEVINLTEWRRRLIAARDSRISGDSVERAPRS